MTPAPAAGSDPIPWAQVHRSEVDRVEFLTSPGATYADLKRAWTGYHELAHLLIPYRGWGDSWFSEGLATYYQNVLQARAGVLDEQQMWQKLYEGLAGPGGNPFRWPATAQGQRNAAQCRRFHARVLERRLVLPGS